jgi:xanthine dehydrogenase YagR molybdenum-binding subunit
MAESPIGTPVNRVDGRLKVTGGAAYSADHNLPNVAHGYLVLSTIGRGTMISADVEAALRSPGVLAVYTPFDPPPLQPPWAQDPTAAIGCPRFPMQDKEVRYYGEIVGMVLAETFEQARDAAALVEVTYRPQPPNASFPAGIPDATDARPPVDILADGVGSIDEALAHSEVTVTATFTQHPEHHNAMEPHATVAAWQGGHLTLYCGSQAPLLRALQVAAATGVDVARVHVVSQHVGGGFGGKVIAYPQSVLAAAAARELDRPVRVVVTREQLFTVTGHRPAFNQTVTLGAGRDGRLNAIKHDAVSSGSVAGPYFGDPADWSRTVYRCPNIHLGARVVTLNVPPATIMRAPNEEPGTFALESAMDELAAELGMDPIALRMANYATVHPGQNLPWSSKHLDECYRIGADRFGWHRRPATPGSRTDGDWLVGMGMATMVYPANRFPMAMRVTFRSDGTAEVAGATADLGTGMWTVLAIIGADSLGIPTDRIRPDLGDSALATGPMVPGMLAGAGGSTATASAAPAVRAAAQAAIRALIQHAVTHERSPFHGMSADDVHYRNGSLGAGRTTIHFGELLTATATGRIEAVEAAGPGDEVTHYAFASFGAIFCEVRVNRWTREPRVSRLTSVVDAGTIVNTRTARNQIVGGIVWGVGQALLEGARIDPDTGRIANANLADYPVPVNADIPPVDVHFLDYPDTTFNPIGARGIGELGTTGAAAAVAGAIHNATGIRVRDLPITLDKLLRGGDQP